MRRAGSFEHGYGWRWKSNGSEPLGTGCETKFFSNRLSSNGRCTTQELTKSETADERDKVPAGANHKQDSRRRIHVVLAVAWSTVHRRIRPVVVARQAATDSPDNLRSSSRSHSRWLCACPFLRHAPLLEPRTSDSIELRSGTRNGGVPEGTSLRRGQRSNKQSGMRSLPNVRPCPKSQNERATPSGAKSVIRRVAGNGSESASKTGLPASNNPKRWITAWIEIYLMAEMSLKRANPALVR